MSLPADLDAPTLLIVRTSHRRRAGHPATMRPDRQGRRRLPAFARLTGSAGLLSVLFVLALTPLASQAGAPAYTRAVARSAHCPGATP